MEMIKYKTRDLGYGSERGTTEAYLTGEYDCWGKQTIATPHGFIYLFDDEWGVVDA